jgi:hypothetical protein
MAYPDGVDNGLCPPTHPHHLISIFYEVWFYVNTFNALNDGGRFVLSNGDPTGYGLHGDFMNGWDSGVLSRAVNTCTAQSGVIEDCPVFNNENRFYTDDENNACFAPNPVSGENDDPGAILAHLPGCVAVTDGPANATPADVVPECVPGVAVNGTPLPAGATDAPPPSPTKVSSGSSTPTVPAQLGNQLAVPKPSVSASTYTTDLGAILSLLQGSSTASSSTSSYPTHPTGSCGKDNGSAQGHRRSRMMRRHGSPLSN